MQTDWPGLDEIRVVTEMINDRESPQWLECDALIRYLVTKKNAPVDSTEDIVQLSLLAVNDNLANFRYECPLKFWIARIVANKAIDVLRKYRRDRQYTQSIATPREDTACTETAEIAAPHSIEDQYIQREQLQEIMAKLREYVAHHASRLRTRDTIILDLIMSEEYTCEEVAQKLGIKRPAVYQVLRKARLFLRAQKEE